MLARLALLIVVVFVFGCSGPRFANRGNGIVVPAALRKSSQQLE
jgi:hypothetical protein